MILSQAAEVNGSPVAHLAYLFSLAAEARDNSLGAWADDLTAEFTLEDRSSIGPEGQLVLPKLFRSVHLDFGSPSWRWAR